MEFLISRCDAALSDGLAGSDLAHGSDLVLAAPHYDDRCVGGYRVA
jgi:hypothetical protein